MENKIITLAYLKMNFSMLFNCNNAVSIQTLSSKAMPFEEWITEVYTETEEWYEDLKEFGIEQFTITYESGLELTFKLYSSAIKTAEEVL